MKRFLISLAATCCIAFGLGRAGAGQPDLATAEQNGWLWETDRPGFKPDLTYPILYTLSVEAVGIAWLNSMDSDGTGFSGPSAGNFRDGFVKGPKPDDDAWYWNYAAHPLWGSETYLRARAQGCNPLCSFLFSAVSSTLWEFGIESWSQRPSSQDLIITPVTGSLIGEGRFQLKRALIRADNRAAKVMVVVIDPLQSLTETIGRVFHQDWTEPAFRKAPVANARAIPVSGMSIASTNGSPSVMVGWQVRF